MVVFRLQAADPQLGDLDGDGRITVLDIVRLVGLSRTGAFGATPVIVAVADVNQDGAVNDSDAALVAAAAAGSAALPAIPLAKVRESSPGDGEEGVSVSRETVFQLTLPLSANTVLNTTRVRAVFGGRQILSRVELASDQRPVTLFYLEPLPGSAVVRVTFDGEGLTDFLGRPVDLDGDGRAGGAARVEFLTLSLTPVENTVVTGRVFASEIRRNPGSGNQEEINTPMAGVTITVDGMEQTLRAVTDAQGNFRLDPAPAGAFFVHIDGRTVVDVAAGVRYPDLSYYPFVGKRWVSAARQEVSIGDVFLPLVVAGTLTRTTPGAATVVSFPDAVVQQNPALGGVSLQVPADSLFSENGVRGGRIGIAPVASNRLPGPLPPGVNPALVITVQTDGGANFDRPVPACFPNLPDPVTGITAKPGEKSALWSFNHDTGRFEIVGSMTVSDDGRLVCTDPGVGITAPGWHFSWFSSLMRMLGLGCGGSGGSTNPREPGTTSHPPGAPGNGPCPNPGGSTAGHSQAGDPVLLFSGEFMEENVDLWLPGRGVDFKWARKYRSKALHGSRLGNNWDSSYDVRIVQLDSNLVLFDGNSREDVYLRQPTGRYLCREFFREIVPGSGAAGHTLFFEDGARWIFHPFDGSARAGHLAASVDRNGNQLSFDYDDQGRLARVIDTLGHVVTIAYNPDNLVESVTDHAGRSVRYAYYADGDEGGSFGDLRSVTTPGITGTPNGNDFPAGKTTSYTYSKGFPDPALNHNLLTVTDGRRNDPNDPTFGSGPYLINLYAPATDPADPNYDRVVRQVWGGNSIDFTYLPIIPGQMNGFAVERVIVRDRVGNVVEHFFDAGNRLVRLREFTGRSQIGVPVTALDNRPKDRLRPEDPAYFETIHEWTDDSLLRRTIHPNGNRTEYVYEGDMPNGQASARTRGNLRLIRRLPGTHQPAGDQPVLEESFEYDTGFGSCCGNNFVTRHVDARGNVTRHTYDDRGNRIRTIHPISSIVEEWEFNSFGQLVAHVLPDNGSGHRRRDVYDYYDAGPQRGWLKSEVGDAGGLNLTSRFEYDAWGHVVRKVDPRGADTLFIVNALGQVVRQRSREAMPGVRYDTDLFYDANDNLIRREIQNRDGTGAIAANAALTTTWEYEVLNQPLRMSREVTPDHSLVVEFSYDANRNRIRVRSGEATAGRDPQNELRTEYDERNLTFRETRAPGNAAQSTSQLDYDPNGNLVVVSGGLENTPRRGNLVYDGYNRLVAVLDPMGNRHVRGYDANGSLIRVVEEGELTDLPGSVGNVRLAEYSRVHDAMDRLVRTEYAFFDPATQTAIGTGIAAFELSYTDLGNPRRIVDANSHEQTYEYDGAGRMVTMRDPRGNLLNTQYDPNGNPVSIIATEKAAAPNPDVMFTTSFAWDPLDRLKRTVDPAGYVHDSTYDSRGNLVSLMDALRAGPGQPGNLQQREYDGIDRQVGEIHFLTSDGTGGSAVVGEIVNTMAWDDNSRLLSRTDGRGNTTRYEYDALNRIVAVRNPDGTAETIIPDVHDNLVDGVDANGTRTVTQYDLLNRRVRSQVTPGPNVSGQTTVEEFAYDGMSRLVLAQNNVSRVERAYDSLTHLTREVLNGRTLQAEYDGVGNLLRVRYPGGRDLRREFDELDQLTRVSEGNRILGTFTYAGPGRLQGATYPNGAGMGILYDADRRPGRITQSRGVAGQPSFFFDQTYVWDGAHNLVRSMSQLPPPAAGEQVMNYDSVHRLVQSTLTKSGAPSTQTEYRLDAAGNRIQVVGGPQPGNYGVTGGAQQPAASARNQYVATPADQRTYDSAGNLAGLTESGLLTTLIYDFKDRLVRHDAGDGNPATYEYDALGRRVTKSTASGVTRYSYLGSSLIEETTADGTVITSHVLGAGTGSVLTFQNNGQDYWLHADYNGSTRGVTSSTGALVETYDYDDFGTPEVRDGSGQLRTGSAVGNPWLFTGHYFDLETAFYHAGARYYDPRAGRFLSPDPIGTWGDPMGMGNAYTYAGNNPASYVDRSGLSSTRPWPNRAADTVSDIQHSTPYTVAKTGMKIAKLAAKVQTQKGNLEDANKLYQAARLQQWAGEDFRENLLKAEAHLAAAPKWARVDNTVGRVISTDRITGLGKRAKGFVENPVFKKANTVMDVVDCGVKAYDLHEKIKNKECENDRVQAGTANAYNTQAHEIWKMKQEGRITPAQAQAMLKNAADGANEQAMGGWSAYTADIVKDTLQTGSEMVLKLTKIPFVESAAKWIPGFKNIYAK